MSPETDQPRQRTVAELLAENGGPGVTGRRRRRREADEPEGLSWSSGAGSDGSADSRGPVEPGPEPSVGYGSPAELAPESAGRLPLSGAAAWSVPASPPELPTELLPRIRDERPASRPQVEDATSPIGRYLAPLRTARGRREEADRATMHGVPAVADEDLDGGPPTVLGAPPLAADDEDAGLPARPEPADHPAGLVGGDGPAGYLPPPQRRLGRAAAARGESETPGWAAVIAQWIAGAVAGAALWVGFRYLWFNLPVVALATAVLVTVALVLGVRALLRNDDLRTTIFAVLVGLLLTVSPAILVLLGR